MPLDIPIAEEKKNPPLNKPKRGGPKKFYVFVKDGDKIKKVTWGDTTGLKVKLNDPKARKSFARDIDVLVKRIKQRRHIGGAVICLDMQRV